MSITRSMLCCVATFLWVSGCAVDGVASSPEIEGGSDELSASHCTSDKQCPVSKIACRLCDDGSYSCPEAECVRGRCVQHLPSCPYVPCAGKTCGEQCQLCAPNDPACGETAVVKYCQPDESCGPIAPTCEPSDKCATVRCSAGTHCIDGACIPDQPKVFCGGIAAFHCPGNGQCVDDPSDDCDPNNGGADCGGMCVCVQRALCVKGSRFDSSPKVCACVPGLECGSTLCGADQVCCSPSCGICGPRNGVCPAIACAKPLAN